MTISRKIELTPNDIEFKKSQEFPRYKGRIEWAARTLEDTNRQQAFFPGDVWREKRSAGVLLDFMLVNGKRYDGGIAALAEKPGKALRMAQEIGISSEKDQQHQFIVRQQLSKRLSQHIVSRIGYLYNFVRYSFKEVAQWLRLFLAD